MSRTSNSNSPSIAPVMPRQQPEVNMIHGILRFLRVVRYRKAIVIVVLFAAGVLGALHYATATRLYESKASLLILQTGDENVSMTMSGSLANNQLMDTYRELIRSEAVLEEALKILPQEARIDFAGFAPEEFASVLRENLSVVVNRGTNILEISYYSRDPRAAAAVVQSVLSASLTWMNDVHKSTAQENLDELTQQRTTLQQELRTKELALAELRAGAGELSLRDSEDGTNVVVKRALDSHDSWMKAREKTLEAQLQLSAVETTIREGGDLQQLAVTIIDKSGNELLLRNLGITGSDDGTITKLKQQLLEDMAAIQSALRLYGPNNQKVQEIQERIQLARQYLDQHRQSMSANLFNIDEAKLQQMLLSMARMQYDQAARYEKISAERYDHAMREAVACERAEAQLDLQTHDVTRLRAFYDVVLDQITNVDLRQDTGKIRAKVIARPQVMPIPVTPKLRSEAVKFGLLGLLIGLGAVYVLDVLDDHFRSPEELQMSLGLPVLAMVRQLKATKAKTGVGAVHVHVDPAAAEAEAFRTLRTALAFADGGIQRLVVSSSEPGDGKTTIVSNLATVYAQSGKRTLLIDADMRRPGLSTALALRSKPGLSTLLRDKLPVDDAALAVVQAELLENLDVIASGPRPSNPTELLSSDRFAEFLAWAETQYDQILIDSPPAMVSDTAIIGRLVDGVLLTIQPSKNRRRTVIRATENFAALGINILGAVINRLPEEDGGGYYGYNYGYGYGYGHDDEALEAGDSVEGPPTRKIMRRVA